MDNKSPSGFEVAEESGQVKEDAGSLTRYSPVAVRNSVGHATAHILVIAGYEVKELVVGFGSFRTPC